MLKYRSRGGVNPSGKQKALYVSIPEDIGYLQDVSRYILDIANIAVFYDDNGDTRTLSDDDILDMNMVILLLTETSLSDRNDALFRIMPMCVRHHIPLLPVGITARVGEVFGGFCEQNGIPAIEVFFPNSNDKSEIGFSHKIRVWLESHLIDQKMYDRVLSNFSNSFFISYRKKDRAILRVVLDMLNKYDTCREVLFWFDEFLTAGESYDLEIQKMIDSSQLFIMLLTENMINEDNYAIHEELSRAIDQNKHILVLDMINKEHDLPQGLGTYGQLTVANLSLDVHIADNGIVNYLEQHINHIGFDDPRERLEHVYLLGMAYYYGYAVLKDQKYGLAKIREAADEGLIEAMNTMIQICVSEYADYDLAIHYQCHIVDYCDSMAMKTKNLSEVKEFFRNLSVLGDYYFEIQDIASHENVYRQMMSALEGIQNINEVKDLLEDAVIASVRLGDVADQKIQSSESPETQGKYFNEANYWYQRSYEYALSYSEFEDSLKARRYIYTPLMRIADEKYMYLELSWREYLNNYLNVLDHILEADRLYPCSETRADLRACYKNLMEIFIMLKNPDEALNYGEKMLDHARQGYLESRDFQSLAKYMEALESYSLLQYELGKTDEALRNLNKATQARMKYNECLQRRGIDERGSVVKLIKDYITASDLNIELGSEQAAKLALEQAMILAVQYNLENRPDINDAIRSRTAIL